MQTKVIAVIAILITIVSISVSAFGFYVINNNDSEKNIGPSPTPTLVNDNNFEITYKQIGDRTTYTKTISKMDFTTMRAQIVDATFTAISMELDIHYLNSSQPLTLIPTDLLFYDPNNASDAFTGNWNSSSTIIIDSTNTAASIIVQLEHEGTITKPFADYRLFPIVAWMSPSIKIEWIPK